MTGIIGYMSGGKTYSAVQLMLGFLSHDHIICTNVLLNCKAVTNYLDIPCVLWKQRYYIISETTGYYHYLKVSDYEKYPCGSPRGSSDYFKNAVYIFIDEVSSIFDSMASSSSEGIQQVATWARHTEKRGQFLYLIMQFPSELHKRLRNHITTYIECTNTASVKIPFLGCGLPSFFHGWIIRRQLMPDLETVLGSAQWSRLDKRIYSCYNTGQIVVGAPLQSSVKRPINEKLILYRKRIEYFTRLSTVMIFLWILVLVIGVCYAN